MSSCHCEESDSGRSNPGGYWNLSLIPFFLERSFFFLWLKRRRKERKTEPKRKKRGFHSPAFLKFIKLQVAQSHYSA